MTPSRPLVSVGVPVYNGKRFVARALDSLLAQDYPNTEIIVSDNCSTDGTRAICERFARQDPRVRVHTQETNLGACGNFEWVFSQARGSYYMWAAADDYWRPTFISTLLAELEQHPEAGLAISGAEFDWDDGTHLETVTDKDFAVNNMTSMEVFKAYRYGAPIWLCLYGLFRTKLLRAEMRQGIPRTYNSDMLLSATYALGTRFRSVPHALHVRTKHRAANWERYSEDPAYNLKRQGINSDVEDLPILRKRILRSSLIPWHRKLFALFWLQFSAGNFEQLPGGSLIHDLGRRLARNL